MKDHIHSNQYGKNVVYDTKSAYLPSGSINLFSNEFAFAMQIEWDGKAGTVPLSREVVTLMDRLIKRYAGFREIVEVAPGRDGSLSVTWDDGRGNYAYLDVGPLDTVHLFYVLSDQSKWEGVSVASDVRILRRMETAFQFVRSSNHTVAAFSMTKRRSSVGSNFVSSRAA